MMVTVDMLTAVLVLCGMPVKFELAGGLSLAGYTSFCTRLCSPSQTVKWLHEKPWRSICASLSALKEKLKH